MKVKVLGTGCTWYPRGNTSYLIDDKMLIDFGSGTFKNFVKNYSPFDIDAIFITHQHLDHIGDLHILIAKTLWFPEKRKAKLKIYAPKGTAEKIIKLNQMFYASAEERSRTIIHKYIDFVDLEDGLKITQNGYKITAFKVEHGKPETFGFTFEDENGKVVGFSADTELCENLHKILKKSNFAFVEMALSQNFDIKRERKLHIMTNEFIQLTEQYPLCKMFPVHTTDETQKFAEENGLNALHDGEELIL